MTVFAYANKHDCNYVLFDSEVDQIEDLQFYGW
jgi:hypothetical protein